MNITLEEYYMDRDRTYSDQLTTALRTNAEETVKRVNTLLLFMQQDGVTIEIKPSTGSPISSGWRPPSVNAETPGAARRSNHMTCQACDLYDPDGALDDWCMEHQARLSDIGLWMEHPSMTKNWCHVQTVPPKSGKRVFYP